METNWATNNHGVWYLHHNPSNGAFIGAYGVNTGTVYAGNGDAMWYLHHNPSNGAFIGAYGVNTGTVYAGNGDAISTLPGDLILDEALAVAKTIIMTNRKNK